MTIEETIVRELSCRMQSEQLSDKRDYTYLHASSIGSCRRAQGYRLKGEVPLPIDSHMLSVFDIGNGVHEQIQLRLKAMGWIDKWEDYIELPLKNDEYRIKGTCDALTVPLCCWYGSERLTTCEENDRGERYIIDIKTISSRPRVVTDEFGNVLEVQPSPFDNLQAPRKAHLMQVNLYAWMAREMGIVDEYPRVMMLYVGKDCEKTSNGTLDKLLEIPYKVFVSDFDAEILGEALKRAKHITGRIDAGELPTRDYYCTDKKRDWHCQTCPFRLQCYPEYFANEELGISEVSLKIIEEYAEN